MLYALCFLQRIPHTYRAGEQQSRRAVEQQSSRAGEQKSSRAVEQQEIPLAVPPLQRGIIKKIPHKKSLFLKEG
jgi:hypothetical protein